MRFISNLAIIASAVGMGYQPALAQTSATSSPASTHVEGHMAANRATPLDLPPFTKGPVSLIGGILSKVDPIHDQVIVHAFGGKDLPVVFDGRTRVMREDTVLSMRDLQPGARVYLDTIAVNGRTFAKTIRIEAAPAVGEVQGQVTNYDPKKSILFVRDERSPKPVRVAINSQTAIRRGDHRFQLADLADGTLVKIRFRPGSVGADAAQTIDVLAQPGNTVVFFGKITFVDLRTDHVAIANVSDSNTYEVAMDQLPPSVKLKLKEGSAVTIHARFDGNGYEAQTIDPPPTRLP